jgi:hypothetical protein
MTTDHDQDLTDLNLMYLMKVREITARKSPQTASVLLGLTPELASILARADLLRVQEVARSRVTCFQMRISERNLLSCMEESPGQDLITARTLLSAKAQLDGGDTRPAHD